VCVCCVIYWSSIYLFMVVVLPEVFGAPFGDTHTLTGGWVYEKRPLLDDWSMTTIDEWKTNT